MTFKPHSRIHIRGIRGLAGYGTVTDSKAPAGYLFYRNDRNLNEHLVQIDRCKRTRRPAPWMVAK